MKKVVIVGVGALGSRTVKLFSEEDIIITVIDRDLLMPENLKNQLYKKEDIGLPKAHAIKKHYPEINVLAVELTNSNIELLQADLVIDCVDNLATRRIINNYCIKNSIPWLHGAAIKNSYEVMPVVNNGFAAIFKGKTDTGLCIDLGIIPEAAERVAELQHELGMKILSGKIVKQEMIRGIINGKEEMFEVPEVVVEEELFEPINFCGKGLFQFRKKFVQEKDFVKKEDLHLFKDGRILVEANTLEDAKRKIKDYFND